MHLPAIEMDMTFQLPTMDMFLPVPSMVKMLSIAIGRLLPAMNMDMLLPELPMVNMLLSAMDIPLLNTDMDRPLPECPMVDMLLVTTLMDMPLSTKDSSTMSQDMNTDT